MLDSAYSDIATGKHCTALGVTYLFSYGVDDGMSLEVDTLNLVSMILWSRIKGDGQVKTGMQSFAEERETTFKGSLCPYITLLCSLNDRGICD